MRLMESARKLAKDRAANALSLGALGIVFTLVGGIVVFLILAEMAPTFLTSLGDFITALVDVEIGSSSAANITEVIISTLAILVGVGAAAFLIGFGLRAAGVGRKG